MTLSGIPVIAAAAALVAAGCQRSIPPGDPPPPTEGATATIHVQRLDETEAVLARLNKKAWVFQHWGGELTSDFTIYHRPEGKDQEGRVIYTASGDDARLARRALPLNSEPGGIRENEEVGYLIVVVPRFPYGQVGSSQITYSFSLPGGAGVIQTTTAETVYPKTVFSHSRLNSGPGALNKPIELTPGETKVLVDYQERFHSSRSEIPYLESEMLRYVLTVTALKDGQLPKRDHTMQTEL